MTRHPRGLRKCHIALQARERARWTIVRDAAAEAVDRAEAARRAGLTVGGLNTLLYRRRGTTAWPFLEGRAPSPRNGAAG